MKIDYSCVQCGAPIVLEETDRLLTCAYCRVRHYLVSEDFFRYYLPPDPRLPDPDRILFVPYGRFRGMFFHLLWPTLESKVMDHNFLALKDFSFPSSLGLRPQTLHLRPALFHRNEKCLTADREILDFRRFPPWTKSASFSLSPSSAIEAKTCIGEVKSVIYAPFYQQFPYWFDAVSNEPVSNAEIAPLSPLPPREVGYSWKVSFLPVLCPDCGWDLKAENESCILFCPHCDSGWEPEGKGFKRIDYEVVKAPGNPDGFFYLPFWRFTPLPKTTASKALERGGLFSNFWLPAFKIAPRLFLLLAKRMTPVQTANLPVELPRLPDSFHPVTLPDGEAREGIPLIWSSLTKDPEDLPDLTADFLTEDWRTDLVFIPFLWTPLELVQPQMKLGLSRSALNLAKYI